MKEIVAAAKAAADVVLEDDVVEKVIATDPLESWAKPSMLQDLEKVCKPPSCVAGTEPKQGNFIEFENLLGEPLREGRKACVPMPTLEVLYQLARVVQWRTKEAKDLVTASAR